MQINGLSAVEEVSGADQVPIWSASQGDTRKATASTFAAYVATVVGASSALTVYSTGSAVTLSSGVNTWVLITPSGTVSALTLTLPLAPTDRQEVRCNSTQIVTTLTIAGNGKTVTGAPTALAANGYFTLKYDAVLGTWYRVG